MDQTPDKKRREKKSKKEEKKKEDTGKWAEWGEQANVTGRSMREEERRGSKVWPQAPESGSDRQEDRRRDLKEEGIRVSVSTLSCLYRVLALRWSPYWPYASFTCCHFFLQIFWVLPHRLARLPTAVITSAPVTWRNWHPGDIWNRGEPRKDKSSVQWKQGKEGRKVAVAAAVVVVVRGEGVGQACEKEDRPIKIWVQTSQMSLAETLLLLVPATARLSDRESN